MKGPALLVSLLAVLLGMVAPAPHQARAAEPSTEPVLRIEADSHGARITRMAVDAAGRYLATGSTDKTVRLWDLQSGQLLRILRIPIGAGYEGRVGAVAMSPDGTTIAAGGWTGYEWDRSNSIYLFDRATGQIKHVPRGRPER